MILELRGIKTLGAGQAKKRCLVILKDLNELETLLFTECGNSIPL